jgi:hypothetical protein
LHDPLTKPNPALGMLVGKKPEKNMKKGSYPSHKYANKGVEHETVPGI